MHSLSLVQMIHWQKLVKLFLQTCPQNTWSRGFMERSKIQDKEVQGPNACAPNCTKKDQPQRFAIPAVSI